MIVDFKDSNTERLFHGYRFMSLPQDIQRTSMCKLKILHSAVNLNDLRIPPGNHLELLHGDREGQHSIRINDQWRICFIWNNGNVRSVEITDYH